ncbi:MAG: TonB-dependent receptor, partial [Bacteroidota bacterium]
MRYALLFIFCLVAPILSFSQRGGNGGSGIFGVVVDEDGTTPLIGAHVALKDPSSQAEITATVTNERGFFAFREVEKGTFMLEVTYIGYANLTKEITVGDGPTRAGRLQMSVSATKIDEVLVKEKAIRAQQKGDTTEFNANAYKTNPDASAEDLLKKMPGVVSNNGQVEAQGERVGRVLVDGREFFGNDPNAALKNLPADVIEKIQVFDQQSDQSQFTGFDDGNTTKTINIVTKSNMRNGQFGKMYAGFGPDEGDNRYQLGANLNFFNKDARISIIGMSNNINIQNFSSEDLLGVVGSAGRGRGRGGFGGRGGRGGGGTADFIVGSQNGISTTNAIGLNYSDRWGDKVEVSGSYFFNQSDNDNLEELNRQFFTTSDSGQVYIENNIAESRNINHRMNFLFDIKLNDKDQIRIRPRVTFQDNSGFENTFGETTLGSQLLNDTEINNTSELQAINFSNSILYRHRFDKSRRTISLNVTTGYNSNSGDLFLFSENNFFGRGTQTQLIDQFTDLLSDGFNLSTSLSYTEPVGKMGMLMFQYRASFNQTDSDREAFDFNDDTDEYDLMNTELSNVFTSDYNTHLFSTAYNARGKKTFFMLRAQAELATLDNEQTFPNPLDLNRNFFNILPMAMMRYQWSREKNVRIFYRTNTQEPSINQLQEVIDNSNPILLSTGNPALRQTYQHSVFVRYTNTQAQKG